MTLPNENATSGDKAATQCEMRYAFRDCADEAEERYLRETLAMLQESYAKSAKPYIDRLVELRSRSMPQMFVTTEQAHALSLLPDNAAHQHTEANHMNPNAKTALETVSENKILPAPEGGA